MQRKPDQEVEGLRGYRFRLTWLVEQRGWQHPLGWLAHPLGWGDDGWVARCRTRAAHRTAHV